MVLCKKNLQVSKREATFTHARAGAGGKLASTRIMTCVHTCAVAERRRSGSKNRSARNGSNTQFTAPASKPRAPNHHCPQEMADPPASAPRMCEHTRGSGAGISKSARFRSATAPRMCGRSFTLRNLEGFFYTTPQHNLVCWTSLPQSITASTHHKIHNKPILDGVWSKLSRDIANWTF